MWKIRIASIGTSKKLCQTQTPQILAMSFNVHVLFIWISKILHQKLFDGLGMQLIRNILRSRLLQKKKYVKHKHLRYL